MHICSLIFSCTFRLDSQSYHLFGEKCLIIKETDWKLFTRVVLGTLSLMSYNLLKITKSEE